MSVKVPHDQRVFDIILFGATGYTGTRIARYLHEKGTKYRWAIAGRSQQKLANLLSELVKMKLPNVLPDILLVDATDIRSMTDTFGEARLVFNVTGPYRFLGKDIVTSCINASTNYMDICGEPQFMEQCFNEFHDQAVEKNILILHACAFDSVPADLGYLYTMKQYPQHACTSIESFLTLVCPEGLGLHYTTYESAVHGVADVSSLRKIRKENEVKYKLPKIINNGHKLSKLTSTYYYEPRVGKYAMPFKGADASVVRSSQLTQALRTGEQIWPQYRAYATVSSYYWAATTTVYGGVFQTLASFSLGRSLLLSMPGVFSDGVFSHEGPTEKQLEKTTFEMEFFAQGYSESPEADSTLEEALETNTNSNDNTKKSKKKGIPSSQLTGTPSGKSTCTAIIFGKDKGDKNENIKPFDKYIKTIVTGPEPGYVATPIIFVTLAISLLEDRASLPSGGVLTPASAFCNSPSIYDRLKEEGIEFRVVYDGTLPITNADTANNDTITTNNTHVTKHHNDADDTISTR